MVADPGVADSVAAASGEQDSAAGFRDIRQHSALIIRLCGKASVQCSGKFALVLCQRLKQGSCVIPAQAGIHNGALDSRLRGNDDPKIKV